MENLKLDGTKSTPEINFDLESGILQIKGESFPENAAKFYTPVIGWIKEYLKNSTKEMVLEFEILYFNSSTSKIFMTLFDFLEKEVKKGKKIIVNWKCDKENETAIEFGEEFKEDMDLLPFNIVFL